MKICNQCKIEKDESWFYKDSSKSTGFDYTCKECRSKYSRSPAKKNSRMQNLYDTMVFNISREEYSALFKSQKGKCAGCSKKWTEFNTVLQYNSENNILLCKECQKAVQEVNTKSLNKFIKKT